MVAICREGEVLTTDSMTQIKYSVDKQIFIQYDENISWPVRLFVCCFFLLLNSHLFDSRHYFNKINVSS